VASLRDIRKRIRSIKSQQKITRAMKLVSASKLRRAQQAIVAARPYAEGLRQVIVHVAERAGENDHPLLAKREHVNKALVIVFTSDRGMAGAFNANAIRATERFLRDKADEIKIVELGTIGRRGRDYFRRKKLAIRNEYAGVYDGMSFSRAKEIADEIAKAFVEQDLDAVYFVYNEFKSAITQIVRVEQLLPIASDAPADGLPADESHKPDSTLDYVYEPERGLLLNSLLPRYLATQVWRTLLESLASEHGARMAAMESATKNASELIGKYTLEYNRARQAAITKELMEIVSGSEAQKG
jgi:F-type H+-transporting ATPase subunit gamma